MCESKMTLQSARADLPARDESHDVHKIRKDPKETKVPEHAQESRASVLASRVTADCDAGCHHE